MDKPKVVSHQSPGYVFNPVARHLRVLLGERESRRSRPRCAEHQDNLERYQADDAARPFAYRHFPLTILVTGFRCVNEALRTVSGAYSYSSQRGGPAQFPTTDEFMSACVVKWTRRRQALAVEASRTVGDALMQLPRHCRVSPPAPTYTPPPPTPPPPPPHRPARSRQLSLLSHQQQPRGARRVHAHQATEEQQHIEEEGSSLALFISAEPRGICHRHRFRFCTRLTAAALLYEILNDATCYKHLMVPECNKMKTV